MFNIKKSAKMVKKKLGLLIIFLALLVVPIIFASTDIDIKTLSNHRISIIVREAGKLSSLESFHKDTSNGEISVSTSVNKAEVDLIVSLKKEGETILNEKFEGVSTGEPISITFIPGEVELKTGVVEEPEINETEEINETIEPVETEETAEEGTEEVVEEETEEVKEEKERGKIIGVIVDGGKAVITSKIAYFIGGIFFAGILYLIVFAAQKKLKFKKGGAYLNFQIKSDKKEELKDKIEDKDKELADAERKLEEAKKELDDIKNRKTSLQEARERFEKDKKELERLGG